MVRLVSSNQNCLTKCVSSCETDYPIDFSAFYTLLFCYRLSIRNVESYIMLSFFVVTVVVYFIKILRVSRNYRQFVVRLEGLSFGYTLFLLSFGYTLYTVARFAI